MSAIEADILEFVKRRCMEIGIDPSSVSREFNLWEGGLLDSVSIVDLIVVIERCTGEIIDLEDLEIETFYSIDAISRAFDRKAIGVAG